MRFTFIILFGLVIASCSSNKKSANSGLVDSSKDQQEQSTKEFIMVNGSSDFGNAGNLKTVYFDYNSLKLTLTSQNDLDANANFLQQYPKVKILIEGHADERGGVQFNLALGEKRSHRIKDYFISKGIASSRITTVSLGKEKPVAFGHDEEAWSKNRRANLVITDK